MSVKLVSYSKDYMDLICGALEKCYGKRPVTPEKAIQAGHLSVLEHAYASFDINYSLAVLGQQTRHRHLGFTVKSSRGSHMPPKYYIPNEIKASIFLNEFMDLAGKCFDLYNRMVQDGINKQHAAYILPKGTLTELRVTGNLRAWFEYLPKRLCHRALPEHREIAEQIHTQLTLAMPEIFNREMMNCANCRERSCEF